MGNARGMADRAKQFMPFASLKGYYDMIREQERRREPKRELSEDEAEELSRVLNTFCRGALVRVEHYRGECYETTVGIITEFDPVFRKMRIVRDTVAFDDIIAAELLEPPEI